MSELCLVTGGAGFIGSNLVRELLSRGFGVRVLDNLSTGRRENLSDVDGDVEVIEGDVRHLATVGRATEGVARVFHEAAIPSVARSVAAPLASHEANATGTLNVLIAARDAGAERVVYASSSSVYGDADRLPVTEDVPPRPISPYAVSKLAGEHYLAAFHASYGLPTVALRYFNVFGPRQDPASEYAAVVPRFATAALRGEPVTIYGDGEQSRDFTFVADVVEANILASEAPEAPSRSTPRPDRARSETARPTSPPPPRSWAITRRTRSPTASEPPWNGSPRASRPPAGGASSRPEPRPGRPHSWCAAGGCHGWVGSRVPPGRRPQPSFGAPVHRGPPA